VPLDRGVGGNRDVPVGVVLDVEFQDEAGESPPIEGPVLVGLVDDGRRSRSG
jgi:hypothetical protein